MLPRRRHFRVFFDLWGSFWGLPGAPCKFWGAPGAPESPENMSGTVLGTPLGARGGPGVDFTLIWVPFSTFFVRFWVDFGVAGAT